MTEEKKNENALAKLAEAGLPVKFDDAAFKDVSAADYLPRVQLMTAMSKKCKNGSFPLNHWAFVKDQEFVDLGETVDLAILAWRPKAIDTGDVVISCYDPAHDEFIRIKKSAPTKDSGCMYGPEFLVYIPDHNEYATMFMGTKSSRRVAPGVKALLHKAATMKSHEINGKKHDWFAPSVTACSTPFDTPPIEELKSFVEKFNNPPEPTIERVSTGDEETEERAR